MKYTMGIDVGVGSLGVAIVDMENKAIIDGVSLIFPTAKTKEDRRKFREQRTQIQRKSKRLDCLRKYLSDTLSVPIDSDRTDKAYNDIGKDVKGEKVSPNSIVQLRSKGLRQSLTNEELFRALMHIARNRGLRLNVGKTTEEQKESQGLKSLATKFNSNVGDDKAFKTIGDKLADLELNGFSIKMRRNIDSELYIFYSRSMIENELEVFLKAQKEFNPSLSDEFISNLQDSENKDTGIFWEQKIDAKKIKESVGDCCYNPHPLRLAEYTTDLSDMNNGKRPNYEKRLEAYNPIFQQKRLYEQLNNIRIRFDGKLRNDTGLLTLKERDALYDYVQFKKETTALNIKKKLGINTPEYVISLESAYSRKSKAKSSVEDRVIKGNSLLIEIKPTVLYTVWDSLLKDEVDNCLNLWKSDDLEKSELYFSELLNKYSIVFSDEDLEKICNITLETGYGSAGITATSWLLVEHKKGVIDNREAEQNLGLTLRSSATGEIAFDRLPYYGKVLDTYCVGGTYHPKDTSVVQYGEIPNAVVSSALNKIRTTINAFIKKHGKPTEINIELSREMSKSQSERDEIQRNINKNQNQNKKYDEIIIKHNKTPSRKYRRALKLLEWQGCKCPYTGETMSVEFIFNGQAVLDHILPREDTQDDSLANLVLCMKKSNDDKGKRTPFEAFAGGYDYNGTSISYTEILQRIESSPESKKWRFNSDAMDSFKGVNIMQKRYETDTAYLARVAKNYLGCLWADSYKPIRVLTGGITSELRRSWGVHNILDDDASDTARKSRSDNRHHLLDAIVIGCASTSQIKNLHDYSKNKDWKDKSIILEPWEDYRKSVQKFLSAPALVKHTERVNNKQGELHRQTPYSVLADVFKITRDKNRVLDKTIVTAKGSLYDIVTMTGLTNTMSDDVVAEKITKHILDDKVYNNLIKALNIEKLELLDVPKDNGEETYKKVELLNIIRDIETVVAMRNEIIRIYKEETDKEKTVENIQTKDSPSETKQKSNTSKERLKQAVDIYTKKRNRRRYSNYRMITKRELENKRLNEEYKGNKKIRPSRVYETSSNSHMDIFRKSDGKLDWQCVAKIDASKADYNPQWKQDDGGASLIMTIKKGDEFLMWDKNAEKDIVVFLLKMSEGDIVFYPVEVSNTADTIEVKGIKTTNPNRIRVTSISIVLEKRIRKIRRNAIGDIIHKTKVLEM